jgi:hypothetical protein
VAREVWIRVNWVVPYWIGLDRAGHEFEQLTDQESKTAAVWLSPIWSPTLSSPSPWTVNRWAHPRHPPYGVDPGSADPYEHPLPALDGRLAEHPLGHRGSWSRDRRISAGHARYSAASPGASLGKLF